MRALLETRRLFEVIILAGLFTLAARNVTDPDVWWHLKTGQLIVETHAVPRTDPYSFTRFGQPWVDHEWLSELLLYGIFRVAGFPGLMVIFGMIIAATLMLVYLRSPARPFVAGIITLWGAFASAPAWGVRPQMISLLLASLFLYLLERSIQRRRLLWWMVPLTLLWANLHAGYALGLALLGLFGIGTCLDGLLGYEAWAEVKTYMRTLALVFVVCGLAVLVNPNGVRLYWYPLETLTSPTMQRYIVEWFSPNFHLERYAPLLLMIVSILALLAFSPRRVRPRDLLLLLATAFAALHAVRHIPIFILVAVPVLSGLVQPLAGRLARLPDSVTGKIRRKGNRAVNALLLAGILVFMVGRVAYVILRQPLAESQQYPAAAVNFLVSHPPAGPVFNAYNWGGYLIWKLHPELRVFIDGRANVYGDSFMEGFASAYEVKNDWQAVLRRWDIVTVVVPVDAPLAVALRQQKIWKTVYQDGQAVVLERERAWITAIAWRIPY